MNYYFEGPSARRLAETYAQTPTPELADRMKRLAARARAAGTALRRLPESEYLVLDGLYGIRPCSPEQICQRAGCSAEELDGIARRALETFCFYLYGEK